MTWGTGGTHHGKRWGKGGENVKKTTGTVGFMMLYQCFSWMLQDFAICLVGFTTILFHLFNRVLAGVGGELFLKMD